MQKKAIRLHDTIYKNEKTVWPYKKNNKYKKENIKDTFKLLIKILKKKNKKKI